MLECAALMLLAVADRVAAQRPPRSLAGLEMVRELARRSPDRGPVKLAITFLGQGRDRADKELIARLGWHDEFSVDAAEAGCKSDWFVEQAVFDMARAVTGWDRLAHRRRGTGSPASSRTTCRNGCGRCCRAFRVSAAR